MREIKIPGVADINHAALDAALRVALGDVYHGHSSGGSEGFRLHLSDAVTPEQVAQARAIVAAHDADALTDAQQEARALAQADADEQPRARQAYGALNDTLDTLTTGWAALTQAQKADAMRDALVLLVRIARFVMARELRRG